MQKKKKNKMPKVNPKHKGTNLINFLTASMF